jgi:hypothetical protein
MLEDLPAPPAKQARTPRAELPPRVAALTCRHGLGLDCRACCEQQCQHGILVSGSCGACDQTAAAASLAPAPAAAAAAAVARPGAAAPREAAPVARPIAASPATPSAAIATAACRRFRASRRSRRSRRRRQFGRRPTY